MKEFIMSIPPWFWMGVIAVSVGAMGYRMAAHGIKIKAGPVEIDATEEDKPEEKPEGANAEK
jgi:hypothetical protein